MSDFDHTALQRSRMIEEQLRRRGISSPRVLHAIAKVPREVFVPEEIQNEAYSDRALGIACGQTISQPYIVGLMTEALMLRGDESVLEIGTGSGYQTAILAELAGRVVTIERHRELSEMAQRVIEGLGYRNVRFIVGDGAFGAPDDAPYDRILAAAAASEIPPALFAQLREGGILVIPLGSGDSQVLQAIRKLDGKPQAIELSSCRFVPFVGAQGGNVSQ